MGPTIETLTRDFSPAHRPLFSGFSRLLVWFALSMVAFPRKRTYCSQPSGRPGPTAWRHLVAPPWPFLGLLGTFVTRLARGNTSAGVGSVGGAWGHAAGSQWGQGGPRTRLGPDLRRDIAGGASPSTPSSRLACGFTCPPPGVNRDPPALAPAETIRPGGRPEEPRRSGANQSEAKIIPSRAQQPRLVGISGSVVAARSQRAHTGPEQQTCARALEGDVRGHGYRGGDGQA